MVDPKPVPLILASTACSKKDFLHGIVQLFNHGRILLRHCSTKQEFVKQRLVASTIALRKERNKKRVKVTSLTLRYLMRYLKDLAQTDDPTLVTVDNFCGARTASPPFEMNQSLL
ncbi:hypothetical protein M9H77_18932 [Catharanthus roseus]|uniref:Uncharacterized protein n=1 Tax=Catharanthus roseus TaxID=4058 RepID=A0ACC0B8T7_CATRO|nr:hypothetical protein M9H77_18932 [Catharanthus roseus]